MIPHQLPPITARLASAKRRRRAAQPFTVGQFAAVIVALVLTVALAATVVGQLVSIIVHWTN